MYLGRIVETGPTDSSLREGSPPLQSRAAGGGADRRSVAPRTEARGDTGRASVADRSAVRLRVPPALPACERSLPTEQPALWQYADGDSVACHHPHGVTEADPRRGPPRRGAVAAQRRQHAAQRMARSPPPAANPARCPRGLTARGNGASAWPVRAGRQARGSYERRCRRVATRHSPRCTGLDPRCRLGLGARTAVGKRHSPRQLRAAPHRSLDQFTVVQSPTILQTGWTVVD